MKNLYKPHLAEIQRFWREHIQPEDLVIDATCGNGHDTLLLSQLAKTVYAIDIQPEAIAKAKELVRSDNVYWFCQSHESFPPLERVSLITYNLGYLPGGNKELITKPDTTLKSLKEGLSILKIGGALTIMCYPGHPGGEEEEAAILEWVKPLKHLVSYTQWPNRNKHPSLVIVKKL